MWRATWLGDLVICLIKRQRMEQARPTQGQSRLWGRKKILEGYNGNLTLKEEITILSLRVNPKTINTPTLPFLGAFHHLWFDLLITYSPKPVNTHSLSILSFLPITLPHSENDVSIGGAFQGKKSWDWPSYRSSRIELISSCSQATCHPSVSLAFTPTHLSFFWKSNI